MGKTAQGFTLVELMVVIAIMGIIGIFTLANYRDFGEDRKLKNAVLDIQSLLRQAQTNATTNVICNGIWQVKFVSTKSLNLKCSTQANTKVLQLDQDDPNISISTASGTSCMSMTEIPFTINIVPLAGTIDFVGFPNCKSLKITLLNSKTAKTKDIMIEKGGRIYEP